MQIIVRSGVMFLFVWAVLRLMGRKELAEMSAFELVLLVVMGDLIQQSVTQQDTSVVGAMLAIATFTLLILLFSYVSYRWKQADSVIEGKAAIVVRDGKPVSKTLQYERLQVDDVKDAARSQGIADLAQVRLGVLESDGKFSFLLSGGQTPHQDEGPKS